MKNYASLRERGLSLIVNALFAYSALVLATGNWVPTGGLESVWFISAMSFWFLSLLSAPWFVPPRDALISAIGAALVLMTIELGNVDEFSIELNTLRWIMLAFCVVVIGLAVSALFLNESRKQAQPVSSLIFRLTGIMGKGELLFTGPAVISIVGAYHQSSDTMAWLTIYWIVVVAIRPVENSNAVIRQFRADSAVSALSDLVGEIDRVDSPNLVRVSLSSTDSWQPNRLFTAAMPDGSQQHLISLFSQTQGSEVVGTGLCVGSATKSSPLPMGGVYASNDAKAATRYIEELSGGTNSEIVGFVVEQSSISAIVFEIASNPKLAEGDVVFVRLNEEDIFYQIVGAETAEESFSSNPRGTQLVKATQLGVYSKHSGFSKFSWLPAMNSPVFSAGSKIFEEATIGEGEFELGVVPSTSVKAVAKIDDLIEYHTAVLGVTGTGKTEVALSIVRNAIEHGAKAFCVDFTGDYRARLADLNPIYPAPDVRKAAAIEGLLATVDAYGFRAGDEKKKLRTLLDEVRDETEKTIKEFLTDEKSHLAIFELADISNSKAGLRLTEIYLSAIMNWAREHRKARQIIICLEEAHTIVPEAFGSGFDGETKWVVERIGQIALQGRKYGVGLLVITQRTALVSKTILSQCNTFLTHSLIDQTSLNFLESVYSSQHTRLIPNLGKFEFLAFGKAIKAERPMVLKREFDPAIKAASDALKQGLPDSRRDADREEKTSD